MIYVDDFIRRIEKMISTDQISAIIKNNIKSPLDDLLMEEDEVLYLKKITAKSAVS